MRKGYWKTLLCRLRGRVAQHDRAIRLGDFTFVLHEICASDDDPLDEGAYLLLALDSNGNALLIDAASTKIGMRMLRTEEIIESGLTLREMIDNLQPQPGHDIELTAYEEDPRTLDQLTRGKSARARGVFGDD